jgi:hypothetical protein
LVDALVSNTNEVTLVPVRLRPWVQQTPSDENLKGFLFFIGKLFFNLIRFAFKISWPQENVFLSKNVSL